MVASLRICRELTARYARRLGAKFVVDLAFDVYGKASRI